jgi:DNA-binding ferritin-like protein
MTQLAQNSAYLRIEDQLDAIGQKYRGLRILRGAILWIVTGVVSSFFAALAAHFIGDAGSSHSAWNYAVLGLWGLVMLAATVAWVIRPLMLRPGTVQMARLLESRVQGLHNGLTNSVLLAHANDLQASPWLPQIFDEIHHTMSTMPVGDAVKVSDLNPIAFRSGLLMLPLVIAVMLFPRPFTHGWQQMFHPAVFVPKTGSMVLTKVQPGDVTLVAGQPLEIDAIATGPLTPEAQLIFDDGTPMATLSPTPVDDGLQYTYRADHIDKSMKYRLAVGGTESPWYSVTIVRQITLHDITLGITPPTYTNVTPSSTTLTPNTMDKPVGAPQGSSVQVAATIDIPANGAMLQLGDQAPIPMIANSAKTGFSGSFTINDETQVAVLLTDGAGQIIAKLPETQLVIHCTKDAAPAIEMKFPTQDTVVAPNAPVKIAATLKDDYSLVSSRVLMAVGPDAPLAPVASQTYPAGTTTIDLSQALDLNPDIRKHGNSIRVQVEATDNRDLTAVMTKDSTDKGGPQTTASPIFEIKFRDPEITAKEEKEQADKLRQILGEMLDAQKKLNTKTVTWNVKEPQTMSQISVAQSDLRKLMDTTAQTYAFDESNKIVQKTLQVLALNPAKNAVDFATALAAEKEPAQQSKLSEDLQGQQRRIISTLESLLSLLTAAPEPATQPTTRPGDQLASKPDAFSKLDDQLKQFMKEQQKLLDQTAGLAKKPVDNYDDKDKKLMADLLQAQDKLDAFMKAAVSDFSKNAEQDMANASMAKEAQQIYSEVTMAKDALKAQAAEVAVPAEESGLEGAKELSSNLEKWLSNTPDRTQWTQEELAQKSDTPMPELPKELQDMVGELMEQQEDLFDAAEDQNANITDSADKGIGWDAADGPIADMSAKGVTGNQLPNNNEMGGRSGEGRSGKSQGEFVGDTAVGKGGRNTPTRLDPTPFAQGQIKDTSKDPVGGATGGGKMSGEGAAGLQGPVPGKAVDGLKRLATKQAEIRNSAERLALQYKLSRYDNFKLQASINLMREVETDLNSGRYQNAMRKRDVLLDDMDTSRMLLSGQINVQQDTTPTTSLKLQKDLNDAMKGELPAAWSDPLKEYYKKLASE